MRYYCPGSISWQIEIIEPTSRAGSSLDPPPIQLPLDSKLVQELNYELNPRRSRFPVLPGIALVSNPAKIVNFMIHRALLLMIKLQKVLEE
jgi:hypothetical protein